jgi:hypothetical protein
MKLLREDPAETTRDILYYISQQLANSSIAAFLQPKYETPQYAVIVNGLFFTSLSCSLITALLAVLALQWVANYDMGLNTSSARKRALQRHTRWTGIEKWKMGEIIASLPLLIFISLFLFFIGIADWLWHLNRTISAIIIGGIGIGCIVYSITNIISIVKLEAPFRTPVSKGLAPLIQHAAVWMRLIVQFFPSEILHEYEERTRIRWSDIPEIWNSIYKRTTMPPQSFAKCEELAVEGQDKDITALESLIWLANSIEITPASRDIFLALTKEIIQLPGEFLLNNEKIDQPPWHYIFTELFTPYFGKRFIDEYSEEDAKTVRHVCKAYSMISTGIVSPALSAFVSSIKARDPSTDLSIHLAQYRHLNWGPYSLYLSLERVYTSISSIEDDTLYFLLLTIQKAWTDLEIYWDFILPGLVRVCMSPSRDTGDPYPIPVKSLYIILDLVARHGERRFQLTGITDQSSVTDRYISTVQLMKEGPDRDFGDQIHQAIQKQLLVHISVIDFSLPSAIQDLAISLELLLQIISRGFLALVNRERDEFIHLLTRIHRENGDNVIKVMVEESLLKGLQFGYEIDDQPLTPWTSLVLAIDEYLESGSIQSQEDYPKIIDIMFKNPPERNLYHPEESLRDILIHIKDPSIALWLTDYCPNDWYFEALAYPDFSKWSESIASVVFRVLQKRLHLICSDLYVTFLRAMIIYGTAISKQSAIYSLQYDYQKHTADPEQVIGLVCTTSNPLTN